MQLRDCLVDLLEPDNVEAGLVQGVYLFEKMRKLLWDSATEFSVQRSFSVVSGLTTGLHTQLGNGFAVGMKVLSSPEAAHRELTLRSLEEIFSIMSYKPCESPLALAAAYISLLRISKAHFILDLMFRRSHGRRGGTGRILRNHCFEIRSE